MECACKLGKLRAQLVFGSVEGEAKEKAFVDDAVRFKVFQIINQKAALHDGAGFLGLVFYRSATSFILR